MLSVDMELGHTDEIVSVIGMRVGFRKEYDTQAFCIACEKGIEIFS